MSEVSEQLKKLRQMRNLTQSELATLAGLSQGAVSSIERGDRDISIATLTRLCDALGITLLDFFATDETDKMQSIMHLNPFENNILSTLRRLSAKDRNIINALISSLRDHTISTKNRTAAAQVLGAAAAGLPIYDDGNRTIEVPIRFADEERFFTVQAKGKSMEPLILNGDYVIAQKNLIPNNGEIGLFFLDGDTTNGYTIKKFYQSGSSSVLLKSLNSDFDDQTYLIKDIISLDKVVYVIRQGIEL